MIRAQPLIFAGASAQSLDQPDYHTQRMLNVYAVDTPPSDYGQVLYKGAAGLRRVADLGGPVRALGEMGGQLYAVAGGQLHRVDAAGTATPLAAIPDAAKTIMDGDDQTILIAHGGGVTAFDVASGTASAVPNVPNASSVAYIDSFAIFTEPGSGRFYVSDAGDLDSVDPLSFATAETNEDNLVRVFVDHREIWLFGESSVEVWYVSGGADLPVSRANDASLEKGCGAPMSVQKLSNTVFWVGNERVVYAASGYVPQTISNTALNQRLNALTQAQMEELTSSVWNEEGREMYALHLPDDTTWVFDTTSGAWWERGTEAGPWRGRCSAFAFSRWFIGGDDGVLYELDHDHFLDGDDQILREMISAPIGDGNKRMQHRYLRLDMGQSTEGLTVELGISKEGDPYDAAPARVVSGDQSRRRLQWNNLGQSRWRTYRLRCFSDRRFYMRGALLGVVAGRD